MAVNVSWLVREGGQGPWFRWHYCVYCVTFGGLSAGNGWLYSLYCYMGARYIPTIQRCSSSLSWKINQRPPFALLKMSGMLLMVNSGLDIFILGEVGEVLGMTHTHCIWTYHYRIFRGVQNAFCKLIVTKAYTIPFMSRNYHVHF